ncbi:MULTISPECIES: N-6 DNA methylase [Lactobacillus]|uniref:site-specific DNA-methyltransferase (adenine-specific) n=1 Tax=Lactobacillus johnsonii TaxID=33959 RepID=A0A9X4XCJ6_LACJH|nr:MULTISPECIES: N-6 DNA methylase [Lactobacillus]MTE03633.1 N-6 DNA methylase [Lactobacillus johnsonii]
MALTRDIINEIIGTQETFEVPMKLMEKLDENPTKLFEEFLKHENDLSFDWFVDYFQEEHADRKNKKQDFTPKQIGKLMNKMLGKTASNLDLCAGTGTLTIERWNSNKDALFICEEWSSEVMPFLLFNLAIRNMNAIVFWGDSLTRERKNSYILTPRDKFSTIEKSNIEEKDVQTIIMNPPYSFKWNPEADLINEDRFKPYGKLAPKSRADYAFVLTGLDRLQESGKMAVVLPHGVLFRNGAEEAIRRKLLEFGQIEAVVGLPTNLFQNNNIPTVVLLLSKRRNTKDVFFIDASKGFEKKKKQNILRDKDIRRIIDALNGKNDEERYSHLATFDEIKENDFNLNIPRYIDTYIPEPPIDLKKVTADLHKTNVEIRKNNKELVKAMKELTSDDDDLMEGLKGIIKELEEE